VAVLFWCIEANVNGYTFYNSVKKRTLQLIMCSRNGEEFILPAPTNSIPQGYAQPGPGTLQKEIFEATLEGSY